jgi:hypothetical protein
MVFHVVNRGVARMQLFEKAGDFQAFERVRKETREETRFAPSADSRTCSTA